MKRSIFILFSYVLIAYFTTGFQLSTGTLRVAVTDEKGDEFIGANVKLLIGENFVKGNATDVYGMAVLSRIEPGKYTVEISAIGYQTYKEHITIYASNISSVYCQLKEATVELSAVVIEESRPIIMDCYGGMSSRNSESYEKLPTRSSKRTKGSSLKSKKTKTSLVIRGGRSSDVITYIDGMAVDGKSDSKTTNDGPKFEKTLTAGELNDFNKFDLWNHISNEELGIYRSEWQINLQNRYVVRLMNLDKRPVINARVHLKNNDNESIWTGVSNNAGRVELWGSFELNEIENNKTSIEIEYGGLSYYSLKPVLYKDGINNIQIPVNCHNPSAIDIAFVVDATGSMNDEINYLRDEIGNVIDQFKTVEQNLDLRTACLFYRDFSEDYVVKSSGFTLDFNKTQEFINHNNSGGGGDYMEAVDTALLHAIDGFEWSEEARTKILFLILDAPPHKDAASIANMQKAIRKAAAKGIRIVPIVCSGSDKSNEYLMRTAALASNGTYLFLTDHSGVGDSHLKPSTDEYDVNYLNDLMLDILIRFTQIQDCNNDSLPKLPFKKPEVIATEFNDSISFEYYNLELPIIIVETKGITTRATPKKKYGESEIYEGTKYSLYPNPCVDIINIESSINPKRALLLDASGQMLREFNNPSKSFSISLNQYSSGIYFIALVDENDESKIEKFVIRK